MTTESKLSLMHDTSDRGYESLAQQIRIVLSFVEQRLIARTESAHQNNDYVAKSRMKEFLELQFSEGIDFVRNG